MDLMSELREKREVAVEQLQQLQEYISTIDATLVFLEGKQDSKSGPSTEDIRDAAIAILSEHGEPMHRKDIFQQLVIQGIHIGGRDPVASLGTVLSRCSKDFHPYGKGIWGLKSKPTPFTLTNTIDPNGHVPDDVAV